MIRIIAGMTVPTTTKGAATRARIIAAAADLTLERGAQAMSLDSVRAATHTSKSQLFHYFPGGKNELIDAVATYQAKRVLEAQRPYLDHLDTWQAWENWHRAVLQYYGAQSSWSCPIGALSAELARSNPEHASAAIAHMDRWRGYLEAGIARMVGTRMLRRNTDARQLSLTVFTALHGGLTLMNTFESIEPLHAGLDAAMCSLRSAATKAGPRD